MFFPMDDPTARRMIAPSAAAALDVPVAPRNPGMPFEADWVEEVRVNRSAVERRTATQRTRRTVKKQWQAAWLLRAVTLMDLTTLSGDDTAGRVRRLCAKARHPVREDLLEALGASRLPIRVGAVGRAIAARLDLNDEERREEFTKLRWQSPISFEEYLEQVRQAKLNGYGFDQGHFSPGVTTVATAIPDDAGVVRFW
jgi:hypothetical protein